MTAPSAGWAPSSRGARSRWARPIFTRAGGKGFGKEAKPAPSPKKDRASVDAGDSRAVEKALRLAGRAAPAARPVSGAEAARGRVDFVDVQEWAEDRDLGDLAVRATRGSLAPDAPLHEQLARRLEAAQAAGGLAVARPRGAPPLPPFERWAFAEAHYLDFLADLLCAHAALEAAIAAAAAALAQLGGDGGDGGDGGGRAARAAAALGRFSSAAGLDRSAAIAADMEALQPGSAAVRRASPAAAALARRAAALARAAAAAEGGAEAAAAALRLVALAYAAHLALLTSGVRVGAAAAERLNLFRRDALRTWRDYPPAVGSPMAALVAAANAAGAGLAPAEREEVGAEVGDAMRRASQLLAPLARER